MRMRERRRMREEDEEEEDEEEGGAADAARRPQAVRTPEALLLVHVLLKGLHERSEQLALLRHGALARGNLVGVLLREEALLGLPDVTRHLLHVAHVAAARGTIHLAQHQRVEAEHRLHERLLV